MGSEHSSWPDNGFKLRQKRAQKAIPNDYVVADASSKRRGLHAISDT